MFIINTFSTCFRHYYAHLQENKTCVTARGVLHWFCWMWLVAVVGRCVVGCEHHGGYCLTQCYNAAPHNRYQPHPAEPAQHTTCSNTRLVLLKMGIMMPKTCWESTDNKHLTVCILLVFSLTSQFAHDARSQKPKVCMYYKSFTIIYPVWCTTYYFFVFSPWTSPH